MDAKARGVKPEGWLEAGAMYFTISRTVFVSNRITWFHLVLVYSNIFELCSKDASVALANSCIFCSLSFTHDQGIYVYIYFCVDIPSQEVHLLLS